MTGREYYKFLMKRDLGYILQDETLVVRKFGFYREKYEQTGDEWIGDPLEGVSLLRLDIAMNGPGTREENDLLHRMGVSEEGCYGGVHQNLQNSQVNDDDFLYCVAHGNLPDLKNAMYTKSATNLEPYDACLRIVDEWRFYETLVNATYLDESGAPVQLHFTTFEDVRYADGPEDARSYSHDFLRKRTVFRNQSEARIMFWPVDRRQKVAGKTLKVNAKGIASCFEDVT